MAVSPEMVGYIDHKQRQIRGIGDTCGGDVHEVFHAPVLFGISKVKLNLEPQAIIVYERCVHQGQVTAEQNDVGASLGTQVCLHDDDDIQRLRELFMEELHLIDTGLHLPLDRGRFEVWQGDVVVIDLFSILQMGSPSCNRGGYGEDEGGMT